MQTITYQVYNLEQKSRHLFERQIAVGCVIQRLPECECGLLQMEVIVPVGKVAEFEQKFRRKFPNAGCEWKIQFAELRKLNMRKSAVG